MPAIPLEGIQPGGAARSPGSHRLHEENDQISTLLDGEMEFALGDEKLIVRPGEVVFVPAGVPHATRVTAGMNATAIEIFAPARKDI